MRLFVGLCLASAVGCGGAAQLAHDGSVPDTLPLGDTRSSDTLAHDAQAPDAGGAADSGDARSADAAPGDASPGDAPPLDPDAGLGGTVMDCGFHNTPGPAQEVMRFVSADQQTDVLIVREPSDRFGGFYIDYDLLAYAVVREDRLHCVDQVAQLAYQSTHHNWVDWAEAAVNGVRFHLALDYQPTGDAWPPDGPWVWTYRLTGLDAAGTRLWGPEDLSCQDLHGQGCGRSW